MFAIGVNYDVLCFARIRGRPTSNFPLLNFPLRFYNAGKVDFLPVAAHLFFFEAMKKVRARHLKMYGGEDVFESDEEDDLADNVLTLGSNTPKPLLEPCAEVARDDCFSVYRRMFVLRPPFFY